MRTTFLSIFLLLITQSLFGMSERCRETFSQTMERLLKESKSSQGTSAKPLKWSNQKVQIHRVRPPKTKGTPDKIIRYVSEDEAKHILQQRGLALKPGTFKQKKWVGEPGTINPKTLGKPKNYQYKIEIETEPGTTSWLKKFEDKPNVEPNRYAIPPGQLDEFNNQILNIKIEKIK